MDFGFVYWGCILGTGVLILAQSLADLRARRRLWFSVAMLVGSVSLLAGVGIGALGSGGVNDPSGIKIVLLTVVAFMLVVIGTVGQFVNHRRA